MWISVSSSPAWPIKESSRTVLLSIYAIHVKQKFIDFFLREQGLEKHDS